MSATQTIKRDEFAPFWRIRTLGDLSADVDFKGASYPGNSYARQLVVRNPGLGSLAVVHGDDALDAYHALSAGDIIKPQLSHLRGIYGDGSTFDTQNISAITAVLVEDTGDDFTDVTSAANSATADDVVTMDTSEASGDRLLFGYPVPFNQLTTTLGTNGVGGTAKLVYYSGSTSLLASAGYDNTAWTDMPTVRASAAGVVNMTASGTLQWAVPTDWKPISINSSDPLYWVGLELTGTYSTNPVGSQFVIAQATTVDVVTVAW